VRILDSNAAASGAVPEPLRRFMGDAACPALLMANELKRFTEGRRYNTDRMKFLPFGTPRHPVNRFGRHPAAQHTRRMTLLHRLRPAGHCTDPHCSAFAHAGRPRSAAEFDLDPPRLPRKSEANQQKKRSTHHRHGIRWRRQVPYRKRFQPLTENQRYIILEAKTDRRCAWRFRPALWAKVANIQRKSATVVEGKLTGG
jgi:hypothetical protein